MARITSTLVSLSALACRAMAAPQIMQPPWQPPCQHPTTEYRIVEVSKPEYGPAEIVGGVNCPSGEVGECQHSQNYEHTVGVSQSVTGGLELSQILGLSIGYGYEWSTQDTVARGSTIVCPAPAKGSFICGLQVRTQMIKTTGKFHRGHSDVCPLDTDTWYDFEVVAPYLTTGGSNDGANTVASFEPCILSCAGSDRPDDQDCDAFTGGWCTAHIIQRQRWQKGVGNKFMFDLQVFDGAGKTIFKKGMQEVDDGGYYSVKSALPWTIELATTGEDNDPVRICYSDQCFACDDQDGGPHGCTLGNGNENGYEDGKREGDFGFSC
ncbi:uncharacterized protein DNG_04429 [Cephalotrichum gorgonifer]|uniref:Uncharacterized protein n=1 Tax=Cephalotrichum gorgonifer TaxID=2041049 RepID=A0AAE8SUJ7_9PEZI|nr:uncharacterized protein DNG_04429 [Cephalotrichum gorgonifer]